MGLLDNFLSRFGDNNNNNNGNNDDNEGDFVKLDEMNDSFTGPGPVVLLYRIPGRIDEEEVLDMLSDGAPKATSKGISIALLTDKNDDDDDDDASSLLIDDLSLGEALKTVMNNRPKGAAKRLPPPPPLAASGFGSDSSSSGSPVALFSGFSNSEMMESFNILGQEVFREAMSTQGKGQYLACATAVPNAMNKPLRQVLDEISGDHADAMASRGPPPPSN